MKIQAFKYILFILLFSSFAAEAQWEREIEVNGNRTNIYGLSESVWNQKIMAGRKHALIYPVSVTGLLIPYEPMKTFFNSSENDPVRELLFKLAQVVTPFKSMAEVYNWLGLHSYPTTSDERNPNPLPDISFRERELPMGATLMDSHGRKGLTFSCATCHSADLFGTKILGLTNRFPRANDFFHQGKRVAPFVNSYIFRDMLKGTEEDRVMFVESKAAIRYVGTKEPQALGLDTSLAQVAMSLSRRAQDAYSTKTPDSYKKPRPNKLEKMIADSKPAVWWTLKYKNRWLSDGSIVSGNPVHTNFLWNEIGRGTDLKVLEKWLHDNDDKIRELTTAVFATQPPRYEKFFGVSSINIDLARNGQKHFAVACARCHGTYTKGWDLPEAGTLSDEKLIQNVSLSYHKKTPVRDVGTDPGRYLGMREFADALNSLQISKAIGTVVEPQKGYVPPPLDGIWSRWPYFHNNSVPNLCALLTKASERPVTYWAGKAIDPSRDFDQDCVGYPLAGKTPEIWKKNTELLYDTRKEGLHNTGHDEGIFLKNGEEIFTATEKHELIEFLKTL
jgi:mono/diheme cytochrome c family protein